MTDIPQQIEALLRQADECELLGGLAVDDDTRRASRERAEELRKLASEAQHLLAVTAQENPLLRRA